MLSLSNGESCIMADAIAVPGASYSSGDLKEAAKLCSYDIHLQAGQEGAMAACPKLFSTFPAIELFKIPQGQSKEEFEANTCNKRVGRKTDGKKRAKFKYSMSCAKTSSIIGYYHISRALNIDTIPVTVLRSMDKNSHLAIARKGKEYSSSSSKEIISRNWRQLVQMIESGDKDITSEDGAYTIGALSENPTGEQKYYESFWPGSNGENGVIKFKRTSLYRKISNKAPISKIINTELNTENYSTIRQMKDAVNMIILDTLFGQKDRFGNVHSYHTFLAQMNGQLEKLTLKEIEDMIDEQGTEDEIKALKKALDMPNDWKKQIVPRNKKLIQIASNFLNRLGIPHAHSQEILLKDNDCGLKGENLFKKHKLIESVAHISQSTYFQLIKLHQTVFSGTLDAYLVNDLNMSASDIEQFKSGLDYVAKDLNAKCKSGTLHQDLNVKSHFQGTNVAAVECGHL